MATRCKFALNYSQCSSCLRNLWSALLSVKSPFKGLSVETGEEGYIHNGGEDKLTHHGCHWILHWRMCLTVASTQAARCRESVAISSRHSGRKINQLGFLQNLLILSWVTFCLNRYEKWNFFQHLHPHPVERYIYFFISWAKTSYGFASGNPAPTCPAHQGENRSKEAKVLEHERFTHGRRCELKPLRSVRDAVFFSSDI